MWSSCPGQTLQGKVEARGQVKSIFLYRLERLTDKKKYHHNNALAKIMNAQNFDFGQSLTIDSED